MTLTTLPPVLEPMVEPTAKALWKASASGSDTLWPEYECIGRSIFMRTARTAILAFLNAALEAGVAERKDMFTIEGKWLPFLIIRTGNT